MTDDDLRDEFGDELTDALRVRSRRALAVPAATETVVNVIHREPRMQSRRRASLALAAAIILLAISVAISRDHGASHLRVAGSTSSTAHSSFRPPGTGVESWTWVSDDHGWALIRKPCGGTVCIGLRETVDGGNTWTSLPAPDALEWAAASASETACTDRPCISSVRFANAHIGWLFGPALFQTNDGGHTWTRVKSDTVVDVEAKNGVAMRITTADRDCGGGCRYSVDRMQLGSSSWQRLPAQPASRFPSLLLQGDDAYAVNIPNGAGAGETDLELSRDHGATWTEIADPCAEPADGYRTMAASAAPNGVFVVLCQSVEGRAAVQVSTDHGATFGPRRDVPQTPLKTLGPIGAGTADDIAIAYADQEGSGALISNNGGSTWRVTLAPPAIHTTTYFPQIGWEDGRTARASFNTGSIWTTRDAGATWTQQTVGP